MMSLRLRAIIFSALRAAFQLSVFWRIPYLPMGVTASGGLKHDVPWEMGNHEDGYLVGLERLTAAWRRLCAEDEWM